MAPDKNKPLLGYTRVSKMGERSEDDPSFRSVDFQKQTIQEYAERHGYAVEFLAPDLDQSGGKLDRPSLTEARKRCAAGEAGGIIAAKLDRLARSIVGLGTLVEEAEDQGYALIAVDFGMDPETPNGRLILNVLGSVAQWERDQRKDVFARSVRASVLEDGVHASRTPLGYARSVEKKNGKMGGALVPDPETFEAVTTEIGERYADGASLRECARAFEEATGRKISPSTVAGIVRSKTYLGIAWHGDSEYPGAHEAAFSPELWQRIQLRLLDNRVPEQNGNVAGRGILGGGLARCGSCGESLGINGFTDRDGSRRTAYFCRNDSCGARASATTESLDALVIPGIIAALHSPERKKAGKNQRAAFLAAQEADEALEEFEEAAVKLAAAQISPERIAAERERLVEEQRQAWLRFRDTDRIWSALGIAPATEEEFEGLDPARKRNLAAAVIEKVEVKKATKRGRHAEPIAERAAVSWR